MDHVENFNIDGQHEEQRGQHPGKEVEIDHVVHADDRFEFAGYQEVISDQGAIVTETLQVIPAGHRHEAHYDGHQPTQQHGCACSPGSHYPLVAMATREEIMH